MHDKVSGWAIGGVAERVYNAGGNADCAASQHDTPALPEPILDLTLEYVEHLLVLVVQVCEGKASSRRHCALEHANQRVPFFRARLNGERIWPDRHVAATARGHQLRHQYSRPTLLA